MDTRNQTYEQVIVASKRAREPTPEGYRRIDVTSRATDIFKTCSPFFVGPVFLYNGMTAKNVENAWQFAKVYREFIGEDGIPTEAYFEWAQHGWNSSTAIRHPMGNSTPVFSWWAGQPLDYIESREQIYIPLYSGAVMRTEGFKELKRLYDAGEKLCLLDYDAYDHQALKYSMQDIISDPKRILGHSFVLKGLLEGSLPYPRPFRVIIAGGRDFEDYAALECFADTVLRTKLNYDIEIVSGDAKGADTLGQKYAEKRGYRIKHFPANWNVFGKRAGMVRNEQMADYADACIAFWDGASHGAKNMINLCKQKDIPIRISLYKKKEGS